MSDIKWAYTASTNLSIASIVSLAGGALASSVAIDNTTNKYDDYLVSVSVGDFAEAGNFLTLVYASSSLDNSAWSTSIVTNLQAMAFIGHLPNIGTGTWRSKALSVAAGFGGKIPPYFKIHVLNDNGATAFSASNNSVDYVAIYRTVT